LGKADGEVQLHLVRIRSVLSGRPLCARRTQRGQRTERVRLFTGLYFAPSCFPVPAVIVGVMATIIRALRCLSVSVGTTVLSAAVLVALAVGFGMPAGTASLVANVCGIPPSYLWNRRWVWRRTGRGDLAREVVPFWMLSLVGLVVSMWFVAYVGTMTAALPAAGRAVALPAANVGVFATLWLAQFVILDRVIFSVS
jgi:putative flippase GtrA